MNLHGIVSPIISVVNPMQTATIQVSTGYTTADDGTRVPAYLPAQTVQCQIQALSFSELMQINGLGVQGIKKKIYLNGRWDGLVRVDRKGGDILQMGNGDIYLVVLVLEYWPDWVSLAAVLQDGA